MCGIAGCLRFDGQDVPAAEIEAMLGLLDHRGPDARGSWLGPGIGLGHTRLSIIDLAGSAQPMASAGGRLQVTFNGEILNYEALRAGLGHPFRTRGDTEVLLAMFQRHGPQGVRQLRGQFAYAVYDTVAQELHLFRDRMGVLPLYYAVDGSRIVFASEIKALLAVLPPPKVDVASLHDYLGHRSVHAPHTLFEGIRMLPPGHWLRVDRGGQVDVRPYWSLANAPTPIPVSAPQACDLVEKALVDAVSEALVADVPVGAYLSGGLDSSLIVALAARAGSGAAVATYSAGFCDSASDELPWARAVSAFLGTDHHEIMVGPEDFIESWARLTWHRDAPLSEPADVAVHRLAMLARKDVKVVLSGEGSDELFAGYPKYRLARLADAVGAVPAGVRSPLLRALEQRLPARLGRPAIALRAVAAPTRGDRLRTWFAPFTADERAALLGAPVRYTGSWYDEARGDAVRRMLYADCHGWLPDNLLARGDRMSMAASLELRPPFLDARLVDLAFQLPSSVKLRRGTTKWVVKEVARRYLPSEVVDRTKVGFTVPLEGWFRGGLRDLAWDLLASPNSFVNEFMSSAGVRELLVSHDRGRRNEHMRLWTLLGLEVWHRVFFVDRGHRPSSPPQSLQLGRSQA
ncbi:MAG: asparagine synthase (glutamine-hydrolyzing) [Pseudonocardiaceae bacterium]